MAIRRDVLEESVLAGLKENLMEPELVREFIAEYHRELNRLNAATENETHQMSGEIAKIEREMDRLVQAIKDGVHATRVKEELETLDSQ